MSYHPPALKCVSELVGIDRLFFGTDHPFFPPLTGDATDSKWESVESNKRAIQSAFGDRAGLVLGGNAKAIFGI